MTSYDLNNRSPHVDDLSLKTGCCGRARLRKINLREKRSRRKLEVLNFWGDLIDHKKLLSLG